MLAQSEVELIRTGRHGRPFDVLGVHADDRQRYWLRAFLPEATQLTVLDAGNGDTLVMLDPLHEDGYFEGMLAVTQQPDYRLQVSWKSGNHSIIDDPYRFAPLLDESERWRLAGGGRWRPYELLGSRHRLVHGVAGTSFAVWAPHASRVAVVGEFNRWDGRRHPMRLHPDCGVWEIFVPGVRNGARYKYEIRTAEGHLLPLKSDPYALQCELRPANASVVSPMPAPVPPSPARRQANALDAPLSIYEVHLGSWRRKPEEGRRMLTWDELADTLLPYACEMGFTHLGLLPVSEHQHDGSWGYRPSALFAPTARHGDAPGLRRFVERCHAQGLGVLIDWTPAHFPADPHGLANFDGTPLYERPSAGEDLRRDYNACAYDFSRPEVCNHLLANALFWLERYGVDGLRVDALASMLFRDREFGNGGGGAGGSAAGRHALSGNLDATAFLRRLTEVLGAERPQCLMLAEEPTGVACVSRPAALGGLGFDYKWHTAWLHDTLGYLARDPAQRSEYHGDLACGFDGAADENLVLALPHDEVVYGKGSLLSRMPGERWHKFANLRALYGCMYAQPGKKLIFMGNEFGQAREWDHEQSLDWHLLADPAHEGLRLLVRDLNRAYRDIPALHALDCGAGGFEWITCDEAERCLFAWVRRDAASRSVVVAVCNFSASVQRQFRIGVPLAGVYHERINTDLSHYGGSNVGTAYGPLTARSMGAHGQPHSIELDVPALAAVYLEWKG